jgi:hypothetical protein
MNMSQKIYFAVKFFGEFEFRAKSANRGGFFYETGGAVDRAFLHWLAEAGHRCSRERCAGGRGAIWENL